MVNHFGVLLALSGQRSPKNLALNKPAYQQSTLHSGSASRAVDGCRETHYFKNSCTHTGFEMSPWWLADLGQNYNIGYITVTNRRDAASKCYVTVKRLFHTSHSLSNNNIDFSCFRILNINCLCG